MSRLQTVVSHCSGFPCFSALTVCIACKLSRSLSSVDRSICNIVAGTKYRWNSWPPDFQFCKAHILSDCEWSYFSDVIGLDPYWIGCYWIGFGWIGFGWIGSVPLHYWMDWIDARKSNWIRYPKWMDDHMMMAQQYCGVVCYDCISPVTTVCS